jgi:peptide-methionine (R)-S-oxide reductase
MKTERTEAEWRELLTPQQYAVARKHGTEKAFSHPYNNEKAAGIFKCICCGNPLFKSGTKFDSGTGWPSFFAPMSDTAISEHTDRNWLMARTEVKCADCDAHLGHVFPDGPEPTGLRYCLNGTVLEFDKDEP